MRHITHTILLIIMLLLPKHIFTQNYSEEIKQTKVFKVLPSGTLEVINKYGSIFVDTWDTDSVKIDVKFLISEKNENRFNKTRNNVTFDFSGNSMYRSVKTEYGSSYSSLFKDLKEATNLLSSDNDQTHVDYYITIPDYINLKIDNKYGDIILPSLNGDLTVNLSNGNLQAKHLNGNNHLDLSFGNTYIKTIAQGDLALNFMDTRIDQTNNISLNSKSSDIQIEKGNLIRLIGRRGQIIIKDINYLFGDTEFCELFIGKVSTEASLSLKYGILRELRGDINVKSFKINSTNADVFIYIPEQRPFNITYSYLKSELNTNRKLEWNPPVTIDDKGTQKKKGFFLKNDSQPDIILDITNAEITIY